MKVLVAIKRVVDSDVAIRVHPKLGIDTTHLRMRMNPFDEIALEEAIRLRESDWAKEVIVVSCGIEACQDILRTALALGADQAIWVDTPSDIQPLGVAKVLEAIAMQIQPDLILLGKQAIDDDSNQTGQFLSGLMNWGQATFASQIEPKAEELWVTREIDNGTEILRVPLPAIITVDLRLNQPRYATLPNIMKAKKKTIQMLSLEQLGNPNIASRLKIMHVREPDARPPGVILPNIDALHRSLKERFLKES